MSTRREISLGSYRVVVGRELLGDIGPLVHDAAPAHRYAVITDENVGPRYAPGVARSLGSSDVFTLPAGEATKTRESWSALTDQLLAAGFGRDSAIVALGGGVIGDLAGFVAATYMRGIPYVQVPTSLLAMIDASVGGKTGVDTAAGKNLVGAFHQPALVVADVDTLSTLAEAHLRAGMAEAIKHGVIADATYFDRVCAVAATLAPSMRPSDEMLSLVADSIEIKARVVLADERESGIRKTLNFGHTIGHAIETCCNYVLLHGVAVGIGMMYEADIAVRLGLAPAELSSRIREALRAADLPTRRVFPATPDQLLEATRSDKKARAGRVEYALPTRIGAMAENGGHWSLPVEDDLVREVLASGGLP